jgi:hypothetical protein
VTHDYKRNSTTTLFAALSMLDGKVISDCNYMKCHNQNLRVFVLKASADSIMT